jgi:tetratricopeptide (TPR) repeat protein
MPYTLRLGRQDIDIDAGTRPVISDAFTLPVSVDLFTIQPHAHYLARDIRATATLPDGTTRSLLLIDDWDFHWQDNYVYDSPVHLPKGTTVGVQFTFDNSIDNPRNPNRPPKRVTYGQTTSSEMANLWLQVMPENDTDRGLLDSEFAPKLLRDDIAGYEKMLGWRPEDAQLRAAMAQAYLEAGRVDEAVRQFDAAVRRDARLKPNYAEAMYELGVAMQQAGKLEEAVDAYNRAVQLDLKYADLHFNLARAYAAQGKSDAAIIEYRRALDITPEDAEVHSSLASILASRNRLDESLPHYRQALELAPNLASALVDLAWILATTTRQDLRDPAAAVTLAERVVRNTSGRNPTALDTLAIAYAAAGRLEEAIATAEAAVRAALEAGQIEFAGRIRERLNFYVRQR